MLLILLQRKKLRYFKFTFKLLCFGGVCTAVDVTPLPEKLEKAERDSLMKVDRINDEEGFKAVEETFDDWKNQADEL